MVPQPGPGGNTAAAQQQCYRYVVIQLLLRSSVTWIISIITDDINDNNDVNIIDNNNDIANIINNTIDITVTNNSNTITGTNNNNRVVAAPPTQWAWPEGPGATATQ